MRCDSCMQGKSRPGDYCRTVPGDVRNIRWATHPPCHPEASPSLRSDPTTSDIAVCNRDTGAAEGSGRECRMRDPCSRGTDRFRAETSAVWSLVLIVVVMLKHDSPPAGAYRR